ncbi:MAG: GntR family transcriptional regulator [Pseudomonadota bacterium]
MSASLQFSHAEAVPQSTSATRRVYENLRGKILTGEVLPGAKLKVDTLKDMLDTGASPIREALSLLTSDQLVERLDQRGFRVAEVSAAQFREILKLRCALEDMALRESVRAAGQEWEEALVLAHHRMVRTPRVSVREFEEQHKSFHMALLAACESPILLKFCDRLYDLNIRYRYLAGRSQGYEARDVSKEHADILAAALDRDVELASVCLIQHYRRTGQFLAERLEGLDFSKVTAR